MLSRHNLKLRQSRLTVHTPRFSTMCYDPESYSGNVYASMPFSRPATSCRPRGMRSDCWICLNSCEATTGTERRLHRNSSRSTSLAAGPVTVKSRRRSVPTLPNITLPECNPIPNLIGAMPRSARCWFFNAALESESRAVMSAALQLSEGGRVSFSNGKIAITASPMNRAYPVVTHTHYM